MKSLQTRDIATAVVLVFVVVQSFLGGTRCLSEIIPRQPLYPTYLETANIVSYEENAAVDAGAVPLEQEYIYQPASSEKFIYQNMKKFGFDRANDPLICPAIEHPEVKSTIEQYRKELRQYYQLIQDFKPIHNVRKHLDRNHTVCNKLDLVPGGLTKIFQSQQISWTPSGYVEPLLPPFRHLDFCYADPANHGAFRKALLDMTYLVHDFGYMCRKLKKTSRIVLIDMGASLQFHGDLNSLTPPIYLTSVYQKMGFKFDHIYAFEITPAQPATVFKLVPESLQSAYHWINVGVSSEVGSKDNPLTMLLREYDEDDLIVVKLDIDTSFIEVPLAYQILEDDRFTRLIDQFYFEHHVHIKELAADWKTSMNGTAEDSLKLFSGMRKKGIPAHFWP